MRGLHQRGVHLASSILLGALLISLPSGASAQNPADVAREVHERGGYNDRVQHQGTLGGETDQFPGGGGGGQGDERLDAQGGDRDIARFERGQDFESGGSSSSGGGWSLPSFGGFGQAFGYLLIGIAVIALVALIVTALIAFWPKGDVLTPAPPVRHSRLPPPVAEDALPWDAGDPDELARQGRYQEAMVALLVRSLKRCGWTEAERGRTAREVLWALAMQDARQPNLKEVLSRTERVRFAGEAATEALYLETKSFAERIMPSQEAA